MTAKELREKYLEFFKERGHAVLPSASLIPENDPTVLFTTAGMHPLVPYLLGEIHPSGTRLTDIQKCLRMVDFDNIGDNTHNTFFQMLGNWSLGDYFKEEAIAWSFEFLTSKEWLGLPLEKLAFTVYGGDKLIPKDDESFNLWKSHGVSEKRIAYWGADNFWSAGETGPCGPSTEMFYWSGDEEAPEVFDPSDEKWVEIWNDVFMGYNRPEPGKIELLMKKNVDTGMGMERTLAVLNGVKSNYETDLFLPLIKKISEISNRQYEENRKNYRIIADHIRAATFILGDEHGVVPSNKDQGYVLRRLIRRVINAGRKLGIEHLFTGALATIVVAEYGETYPELRENEEKIITELNREEEKFKKTIKDGLKKFDEIVGEIKGERSEISGKQAFDLYQSFGLPIDMVVELAEEKGLTVDAQGFEAELKQHQSMSRTGSEQKFKGGLADTSEISVKYHTATHLLHAALQRVLGSHVLQRGSNITAERLRFDFSHPQKVTPEEIKKVEDMVNNEISKKTPVKMEEMTVDEAKASGATGVFEHKYGDKVKVYAIGDFSKEICGGPHVDNTGELGIFKIIKEEASSAGIRRIKAVLEH
jgi:alanyl-tRNA synthetase